MLGEGKGREGKHCGNKRWAGTAAEAHTMQLRADDSACSLITDKNSTEDGVCRNFVMSLISSLNDVEIRSEKYY